MNVIIIFDEKKAPCSLCRLIDLFCPAVNISGNTSSLEDAIYLVESTQPDLVFLDLDMKNNEAQSLLFKLKDQEINTVIVTEEVEYALYASKTESLNFLLRPIDPERLIQCIRQAAKKLNNNHSVKLTSAPLIEDLGGKTFDRIGVPTNTGIKYIALKNILYFKSHDNYTEIIQEKCKPILVSKSLKCFETHLIDTNFLRVHQSYLINTNKVIEIQKCGGGMLILDNNHKIPISRSKKECIKKKLDLKWKLV